MDPIKVYTRRILDDLRIASELFSDVELVSKDQKIVTSSLILASLSGTLNAALKDLIYENIDEKIQVILPSSEIDFYVVSSLFTEIVFNPDEDLVLDERYHEVLDYLDIKSSFHSAKPNSTVISTPSTHIKHVCQYCSKSFNLKKLLARHVRTFHSENPYKCSNCGRLCRNQSELKIHQRVHTKERPHSCAKCHRSFTQVSHLNEHVHNVHYGPDDVISGKNICEICGDILSSRGAVQRHMKQHEVSGPTPPSPPIPPPRPPPSPPPKVETVIRTEESSSSDHVNTDYIEKIHTKPALPSIQLRCDFEGCGKILKTHSSFKLHMK